MTTQAHWPHDAFFQAWYADAEGLLLAGEYPGQKADDEGTRRKLSLLAAADIRTIIDLTDPSDKLTPHAPVLSDVAAEHRVDLRRLSHPIKDVNVTTPQHYDQIIADIEHELAAGRKVFVHCWGGVGRTGTVVGVWLVHRGLTAEAALDRITTARQFTRKRDRRSPETDQQETAIHDAYVRRQSRSPEGTRP